MASRTNARRLAAVPIGLALTILVAFASVASAATLTLSTDDGQFKASVSNQGWWSPTARNNAWNDNYQTGRAKISGREHLFRNFFTFDLSGVAGDCVVGGATLRLWHGGSMGSAEHELGLFDVSTPTRQLNMKRGTSNSIYNDLGSGVQYGSVVVQNMASGTIEIPLNDAAVEDMQDAVGGYFSIGGSLTNLAASGNDALFLATGAAANELDIECMPPKSAILIDSGVPGLGITTAPGLQQPFNENSAADQAISGEE